MKNVIVIAPHPDDETLGAGGTILRHIAHGDQVHWVIVTSPRINEIYDQTFLLRRSQEIEEVAKNYELASTIRMNLPAMELDNYPKAGIVTAFSSLLDKIKPEIAYIPFYGDIHSDHRVIHQAFISASKIFRAPYLKRILMMEIISETDNPIPESNSFKSQCFVDIGPYVEKKNQIMQIYASELGDHPFPRSLENLKALAHYRGSMCGVDYAESFMLVRDII